MRVSKKERTRQIPQEYCQCGLKQLSLKNIIWQELPCQALGRHIKTQSAEGNIKWLLMVFITHSHQYIILSTGKSEISIALTLQCVWLITVNAVYNSLHRAALDKRDIPKEVRMHL